MKLNTVEKFLLIAHHPDKGRFILSDIYLTYGLIGAILLDMSVENRISVEDDMLLLLKNDRADDVVISDITSIIGQSEKKRKMRAWITRLSQKSVKYRWIIIESMTKKRIMRIENKKFLGLIPYRISYLNESYTRTNILQHLKNNILSHKEMSHEDVILAGLIEACRMHRFLSSDKDEQKKIKHELKQIIQENPIAGTVSKTIKEVQAAVLGAIAATTAATSAAAHH